MAIVIDKYISAGYPVLYVHTGEQDRAMEEILANLKSAFLTDSLSVYTWKSTVGLVPVGSSNPQADKKADEALTETLRYIGGDCGKEAAENCLYILFNAKEFLKNPILMQQFRDVAYKIRMVGSYIIMIGGAYEVPEELEDIITFVDLELPTKAEIKAVFVDVADRYRTAMEEAPTEEVIDTASENALGLTLFKAENAISLSIAATKSINIDLIRKEKQLAVKQSGVIEFIDHSENMDSLGGFDILKDHVRKRRKYFSNHRKAIEFGLRPPKGAMLVGLAGCGKTLAAKAVSAEMNLPLYKFDIGAVFKGVVGGSEAGIRNAIKLAETVAPCVLLIDEMEKLVAGLESSGKSDSGVTSRVIGTLLSWMQETKAPIYKLATCNTIRNLDSALFRRGRWDALFAVDLPTLEERKEILSIHLRKRGRDANNYDLNLLAKEMEGFVGAEIESVVDEALYIAFDADRELDTGDLKSVADELVPISKTDQDAISAFRDWMKSHAAPVSSSGSIKSRGSVGGDSPARKIRNLKVSDI